MHYFAYSALKRIYFFIMCTIPVLFHYVVVLLNYTI
jgi:hypothetical protein